MDDTDGGTSILVASIDAVAISPADAQKFIDNRRERRLKRYPDESPDITQFNLSHEIITHYAQMAAGTSAVAAVPGAWPGVGTAIVLGVTAAEMPVGMKYQLDMTRCLMVLHGYDLIHDIGEDRIKDAVAARNVIVHEGVYKGEDEGTADLWGHAMVIRELVIRIVFRSIGYEGQYTTHLGGWRDAVFPPPPSH